MGLTLETALTRTEVERVVSATRTVVQGVINDIRPETLSETPVRGLRQAADDVAELGRELLGRRPELTTHTTTSAMNLRLLAHVLYSDHNRADEILSLNPSLGRGLPIIPAGTEVLVYAE